MNQLDQIVSKNGFHYKLVERQNCGDKSIAIYSQHEKNDFDNVIAYEVFIIPQRKKEVTTLSGVVLPPSEVFPSNEKIGVIGKSVYARDEEVALMKAKQYFQTYKTQINGL